MNGTAWVDFSGKNTIPTMIGIQSVNVNPPSDFIPSYCQKGIQFPSATTTTGQFIISPTSLPQQFTTCFWVVDTDATVLFAIVRLLKFQ